MKDFQVYPLKALVRLIRPGGLVYYNFQFIILENSTYKTGNYLTLKEYFYSIHNGNAWTRLIKASSGVYRLVALIVRNINKEIL